jgi:hypothetical protein
MSTPEETAVSWNDGEFCCSPYHVDALGIPYDWVVSYVPGFQERGRTAWGPNTILSVSVYIFRVGPFFTPEPCYKFALARSPVDEPGDGMGRFDSFREARDAAVRELRIADAASRLRRNPMNEPPPLPDGLEFVWQEAPAYNPAGWFLSYHQLLVQVTGESHGRWAFEAYGLVRCSGSDPHLWMVKVSQQGKHYGGLREINIPQRVAHSLEEAKNLAELMMREFVYQAQLIDAELRLGAETHLPSREPTP